MHEKYFSRFLFLILLFISNNLYGGYEPFEEDVEESKKIPLISGIRGKENIEDIITGKKTVITVCTTTLKSIFEYDHVSLVFEMKHPGKNEINLFSVHFGGDGYSFIAEKNRPIIDNTNDTLKKCIEENKQIALTPPMSS